MTAKTVKDVCIISACLIIGRKQRSWTFCARNNLKTIKWGRLRPNRKHTWLVSDTEAEFESHIPIGSKEAKRAKTEEVETIFKTYCPGLTTSRDAYVYGFEYDPLAKQVRQFAEDYNAEVDRYKRRTPKPENIDRLCRL